MCLYAMWYDQGTKKVWCQTKCQDEKLGAIVSVSEQLCQFAKWGNKSKSPPHGNGQKSHF